jgi:hypothetical protein
MKITRENGVSKLALTWRRIYARIRLRSFVQDWRQEWFQVIKAYTN